MNPYPWKTVRRIIACQMPGDTRRFAVLGITAGSPEEARIALVEPDEATFEPGKPLGVTVVGATAIPGADGESVVPFRQVKPGVSSEIGSVAIAVRGTFFGGRTTVVPDASAGAGPVRLVAGIASSSLLGLMPVSSPGGPALSSDHDRGRRGTARRLRTDSPSRLRFGQDSPAVGRERTGPGGMARLAGTD